MQSQNDLISRMARGGALSRLTLWIAVLAIAVAAIRLVSWIVGAGIAVVGPGSGGALFGFLALLSALLVMSRSDREVGAYGLAIRDAWRRDAAIGFGVGCGLIVLATALAIGLGGWTIHVASIGKWVSSLGKAFGALPLAIAATVTYAGFVSGALGERGSKITAIATPGLLYGAASLLHPGGPTDGSDVASAITAALLMATAASFRWRTGDIVRGAMLLCGVFFAERFIRKVALLGEAGSNETAQLLFAPGRYPLQSPAVWVGLAVVLMVTMLRATGRPEDEPSRPTAVSPTFARSYPFATMGALAPLDVWLPQLWRARFRIDVHYLVRFVVTIIMSSANTLLTAPERLFHWLISKRAAPANPVFLVGAHRSGTTHLHNLMSLDPQFVAPTTWQVLNPFGFRFSGRILRPFFDLFSPWKRPMDAVAFGMWAPAEEEFAVANMSGLSPDWSLRLPRLACYYDRFGFPAELSERERGAWAKTHATFLSSLRCRDGQRLLLKNPHNTGRIALLRSLYPEATFVHIRRNPLDVIRSNAHLERTAHVLFQLQDPPDELRYETRYLSLYRDMELAFYEAAVQIPVDHVIDIRYEDLAANPKRTLRCVYDQLNLTWTQEYESRLDAYLKLISDYKPTPKKSMPPHEVEVIETALADVAIHWARSDATLDPPSASQASE